MLALALTSHLKAHVLSLGLLLLLGLYRELALQLGHDLSLLCVKESLLVKLVYHFVLGGDCHGLGLLHIWHSLVRGEMAARLRQKHGCFRGTRFRRFLVQGRRRSLKHLRALHRWSDWSGVGALRIALFDQGIARCLRAWRHGSPTALRAS